MNFRAIRLAASIGAAALLGPPLAVADDRLPQAIHHMSEAVVHGGKLHDAGLLAYHADLALEKAESLEKYKPNPHTSEAVVHIKAAIDEARAEHVDAATKHAREGLQRLEDAAKETSE